MTQTHSARRAMLEKFVAANPNDAFARYGLAMECASSGDPDAAVEHYEQLLAAHPDYVAGYFHYGQLLARLARTEEARRILSVGAAAAQKAGDLHARDEMEAALKSVS